MLVLAGVAGGGDLALDAPLAEAAGDHDAVEVAQAALGQQPLDLLGLDPVDLDLGAVVEAAVLAAPRPPTGRRRAGSTYLPMRPMRTGSVGRLDPLDQRLPLGAGRRSRSSRPQDAAHHVVEALLVEDERDLVEVAGVGGVDDAPRRARRTGWRSCA